jgi:hypothetical protein
MSNTGWIGVDLDGTLAHYTTWPKDGSVGAPIPKMVNRVREWLKSNKDVRIFTARIAVHSARGEEDQREQIQLIQNWCYQHIGKVLPITYQKDYAMVELWDDRAVQIVPNTGERADGQP